MTQVSIAETGYAKQTLYQRKHGGGVGRSKASFWKHEAIKRAMRRQLPILAKRGRGLIIDLNAGDGEATPHRQPDFFAGGALITTPHLALAMGDCYGADVWLCERSHAPRRALSAAYGDRAKIYGNHNQLSKTLGTIAAAPWVMVLSDPNGHGNSSNGLSIMRQIAQINPISDFVTVVNHRSIMRHLGVGAKDNSGNAFALAVEASKEHYAWMLTPQRWADQLGKRQVLATEPRRLSPEMTAQILLISNFIPGHRQ